MAQAKAAGAKRAKKVVEAEGIAHITATFNNTLITITDMQGDALSHREVRGGAARLRAGPAWPVIRTAAQGVRLSTPAARETEGQADLRALGAAVPKHLRSRAQGARGDR